MNIILLRKKENYEKNQRPLLENTALNSGRNSQPLQAEPNITTIEVAPIRRRACRFCDKPFATYYRVHRHEKTCRFNPEKRAQTPPEPRRHSHPSRTSEGKKVAAKAKKPTEKPIIIHDDDSA
ncbi:hypothetical protein BLNAU_19690 [Blattamonas nauphoetae]|uniref:C2H2-type domain-containing protein n=1 Tax=Blattamonas nauphoetae TaxID=2049346 RepID=A0ABQ9X0N8_9EUKA|nr:hypothetical protein BLNAU_19690 [Blattamonas nauphoetae]